MTTLPTSLSTVAPGHYLQFASDNTSGICPEAMQAFMAANTGFAASYGNDDATRLACDRIREVFEADAEVFFVFNGTAAKAASTVGTPDMSVQPWCATSRQ